MGTCTASRGPRRPPGRREVGEHVTRRERAGDRIELVAALEQAGGGGRIQVCPQCDDEYVALERPGIRLHALGGRIDRLIGRLDEPARPA